MKTEIAKKTLYTILAFTLLLCSKSIKAQWYKISEISAGYVSYPPVFYFPVKDTGYVIFDTTHKPWVSKTFPVIYRTFDGGNTYKRLYLPFPQEDIISTGFISKDTGYATLQKHYGDTIFIYRTYDAGNTWTPKKAIVYDTSIHIGSFSFTFVNSNLGYNYYMHTGDRLCIYMINNDTVTSLMNIDSIYAVHVYQTVGTSYRFLIAQFKQDYYDKMYLVKIDLKNKTWKKMAVFTDDIDYTSSIELFFIDAAHGFVVTDTDFYRQNVYFTSDSGNTFMKTDTIYGYCTYMYFINKDTGFIVTYPHEADKAILNKTIDGGFIWKAQFFNDTLISKICFVNDSIGYMLTHGGVNVGDYQIYKTSNCGYMHNKKALEQLNLVKVYPNPVRENLIIEIKSKSVPYDVIVRNSIGQVKAVFTGNRSDQLEISAKSLAKGLYFVIVSSREGQSCFKIIKD